MVINNREISDDEIRVIWSDSKLKSDVCDSLSYLLSRVNVKDTVKEFKMPCIDEDWSMSWDFSKISEPNVSEEVVWEILLKCRKEKGDDFRRSLIDLLNNYSSNFKSQKDIDNYEELEKCYDEMWVIWL